MFKVLITTDAETYVINLDKGKCGNDWVILSELDAWHYVKYMIKKRRPLEGVDSIISIEKGSIVKSIEVAEITDYKAWLEHRSETK